MTGCPARVELQSYVSRDGSLGPEWYDWIEAHVEDVHCVPGACSTI